MDSTDFTDFKSVKSVITIVQFLAFSASFYSGMHLSRSCVKNLYNMCGRVSIPVRIFSPMMGRLWRAVPTYTIEIPRSRLVVAGGCAVESVASYLLFLPRYRMRVMERDNKCIRPELEFTGFQRIRTAWIFRIRLCKGRHHQQL